MFLCRSSNQMGIIVLPASQFAGCLAWNPSAGFQLIRVTFWLNRMLFSLNAQVVYNLPSAKLMSYLYMYKMDLNAKKLINVVLCHMTISTITFTSKNIKNLQDTSQNFCQLLLCDKAITLQVHNKCSKKGKPLTHKAPVITKSIKTYSTSTAR